MKKITIGFSPCPNDTFIFDALVNRRIESESFLFEPILADVEELNKMALDARLDVTKMSLGAYAQASSSYIILDSGSALGKGVGPLLVSKTPISETEFSRIRVAIPGVHTTANLLFTIFFPRVTGKYEMLFSEIENEVLAGKADAGLLIHEGRFTYAKKGLHKLFDLGELWETKMVAPLPLGCIAASRNLSGNERSEISILIRKSIEYGYLHPDQSGEFIRKHAQEMDESVIASHIALYVNEFSLNLGPEGRSAITLLLNNGIASGLLPVVTQPIFNSDLL